MAPLAVTDQTELYSLYCNSWISPSPEWWGVSLPSRPKPTDFHQPMLNGLPFFCLFLWNRNPCVWLDHQLCCHPISLVSQPPHLHKGLTLSVSPPVLLWAPVYNISDQLHCKCFFKLIPMCFDCKSSPGMGMNRWSFWLLHSHLKMPPNFDSLMKWKIEELCITFINLIFKTKLIYFYGYHNIQVHEKVFKCNKIWYIFLQSIWVPYQVKMLLTIFLVCFQYISEN